MSKKNFSIRLAIKEGFKGFGKWWLPLCAVSIVILLSQSWLPKFILRSMNEAKYLGPVYRAIEQFESEILSIKTSGHAFSNLRYNLSDIAISMGRSYDFHLFAGKIVVIFVILFLILCLLYIVTIIISKLSVSKSPGKINYKAVLKRTPAMSFSYLILCIIKVLPFCIAVFIPLFFFVTSLFFSTGEEFGVYVAIKWLLILFISAICFIFGICLYIRLYFTGFIITEESSNPFKAIEKSLALTKGLFIKVAILFIATTIIDIVSLVSIIGFIPANSIKYTLRASAYRQILDKENLFLASAIAK